MELRRVRIAVRLGLIPRGTEGTIQVNWKLLEGVVCWVDVAYKTLGGRKVLTIDNYELMKHGARTQSTPPLHLAGAEVEPVVDEHLLMNPTEGEHGLVDGECFFHYCELASYRNATLFCGETQQIVLDMAYCPFGLWHKGPDGLPVEGKD